MNKETLAFYSTQGPISNPGEYRSALEALPTELPELVKVVQNLTLHIFWAERYGFKAPPPRQAEVQLRLMEKRLKRMRELDKRPFTEKRALPQKIIGNCRDFSLFLAAALRAQGKPARARCGFGTYFRPHHYEDHWVAEVWEAGARRWRLVDAQLDEFQCQVLKVDFDPLDVPRDQFITGGLAWQMCRLGSADPRNFGIFNMRGLGFIRGNLVRDLAALNKMELLPWDCWGIILERSIRSAESRAVLDEVANLTAMQAPDLAAVQKWYADPRFHVDGQIVSFTNAGREVEQVPV